MAEGIASSYFAFKHIHLTLIALSVGLYLVRFGGHLTQSGLLQYKVMKIAPHVIDTLLIVSGLSLCFMIHQYPISAPWLTEKVLALLAYIVLAVLSIKSKRGRVFKVLTCLGALSWVVFAANMAVLKHALFIN